MSLKRKRNDTFDAKDLSDTKSNGLFFYLWSISKNTCRNLLKYEETVTNSFKDNYGNNWCLKLDPIFLDEDDGLCSKVGMNLTLLSSEQLHVQANFNVTIYDEESMELESMHTETSHDFMEDMEFKNKFFIDPETFENDMLIFLCKINFVNPFSLSSVCGDLGKLFESGNYSDVTLAVDNKEFKAHKTILSARSDVFAAMFQHEMMENKSNHVIINDIEPEVVHEMLRFVYTGYSPKISQMTAELLAAADKYDIKELRDTCIFLLIQNIAVENVPEMLVLADRYNVDQLKAAVVKLIHLKAAKVMASDGWKNLCQSHGNLTSNIIKGLPKLNQKRRPTCAIGTLTNLRNITRTTTHDGGT